MTRVLAFMLAAMTAFATPTMAATQTDRIRGTIESVDQNGMNCADGAGRDGKGLSRRCQRSMRRSSSPVLSKVEKGSFIGTATKGTGDFLVALEVVIFPPSMRGTGEGHYAWDKLPDTTLAGGSSVSSSMTNGTVETASSGHPASAVNTSMTNGDIQSASEQGGAKQITVHLQRWQSRRSWCPPPRPIVAFEPADRLAVMPGAHVFIKASEEGGKATADFVAVGKDGLAPPM